MPQEALVTACAGGANDRKIACETLAGAVEHPRKAYSSGGEGSGEAPWDFPPESILLSDDAGYDWFEGNAIYERKDSTRGYSYSGSLNPSANPNSQRFSANRKSKASIIGLPKTQKTAFGDAKRRMCKPANICQFPKRVGSVGKSATPVEPGSPNVTCMGRVRSKRSRRRSNSTKRGEKPAGTSRPSFAKPKAGFCSKVMGMFRSKKAQGKLTRSGRRNSAVAEEPTGFEQFRRVGEPEAPVVEAPGLGGLNRFASGRRSVDFSRRVG